MRAIFLYISQFVCSEQSDIPGPFLLVVLHFLLLKVFYNGIYLVAVLLNRTVCNYLLHALKMLHL